MVVFYIGICVMLFGGGAFIAFFSRLVMSLMAEQPINADKVMIFSIIWFVVIVIGAILVVVGHFLKKKEAAASAASAATKTAEPVTEAPAVTFIPSVENAAAPEADAEAVPTAETDTAENTPEQSAEEA